MGKFEWRSLYNSLGSTITTTTTVDTNTSWNKLFEIKAIDEQKIMKIPIARAAIQYITNNIAATPIYLYREYKDADGKVHVEKIANDHRVNLLNHENSAYGNGQNLKKRMAKDYLLHGATYVAIDEDIKNGVIKGLYPLNPEKIVVDLMYQGGFKIVGADIKFTNIEGNTIKFKPHELIIAVDNTEDDLTGRGLLKDGEDIFIEALSEMKHTKNHFERGGAPHIILKYKRNLKNEEKQDLRDQWSTKQGGVDNAGKPYVLNEDADIIVTPHQELKMNEFRTAIAKEICKMFNIHHSVLSGENQNNSDLEQNMLAFLVNCLRPIITGLESSYDKALLLEDEKADGYFFNFDTSDILRTTEKQRVETYSGAFKDGLMSLNESREKMNMPKIKEDRWAAHSGQTFIDEDGKQTGQGLPEADLAK